MKNIIITTAFLLLAVLGEVQAQQTEQRQPLSRQQQLKRQRQQQEWERLTPEQRQKATLHRQRIRTPNDPNNPYNTKLTPLTDLGKKTYQGEQGGLYPGGRNVRPKSATQAGITIAKTIRPLNKAGKPDAEHGKIVWLSIGMSNTFMETKAFIDLVKDRPEINPCIKFINGGFGSMAIDQINNPDTAYWDNIVKQRLIPQGLSPEQVQVIWFKTAQSGPEDRDSTFMNYIPALADKYISVIRIIRQKFPNVKQIYLSPRIYAGYAKYRLSPEPFAWYTGWAIKRVIEMQLNGDSRLRYDGQASESPWLSWGPYLWANGSNPNSDGLRWDKDDLGPDGTHPSPTGSRKVADMLLEFFSNDPASAPWFLKQ